jgi:hypothetical protein
VQHVGVVVALAEHRVVLVHAEAGEVHRLPVDQKPGAVDGDRPHTDALVVTVHSGTVRVGQLQLEVVEVAVAGRPPVHGRHGEGATRASAGGDLGPLGVAQDDAHLDAGGVPGLDAVVDGAGAAVEAHDDRDVGEMCLRRAVEPHGPVNAGVVEEVVPVALPFAVRGVLDDARRDRLEAQRVVDDGGDPRLFAGRHVVGHVGLERGVAALVGDDLGVADPHRRPVGRGLEVQDDALPVPAPRHSDGGLVPDVAEVVTHCRVGADVVEARRDGHLRGGRERPSEPSLGPAGGVGVEGEAPQSVQGLPLTGGRVLRAKHLRVPPWPSTG